MFAHVASNLSIVTLTCALDPVRSPILNWNALTPSRVFLISKHVDNRHTAHPKLVGSRYSTAQLPVYGAPGCLPSMIRCLSLSLSLSGATRCMSGSSGGLGGRARSPRGCPLLAAARACEGPPVELVPGVDCPLSLCVL